MLVFVVNVLHEKVAALELLVAVDAWPDIHLLLLFDLFEQLLLDLVLCGLLQLLGLQRLDLVLAEEVNSCLPVRDVQVERLVLGLHAQAHESRLVHQCALVLELLSAEVAVGVHAAQVEQLQVERLARERAREQWVFEDLFVLVECLDQAARTLDDALLVEPAEDTHRPLLALRLHDAEGEILEREGAQKIGRLVHAGLTIELHPAVAEDLVIPGH